MNLCRSGSCSVLLVALALAAAGLSTRAATTNYAGLVYSGNTNIAARSGIFLLYVSPTQTFRGRLYMGNRHATVSGRFDTNGAADVVAKIVVEIGTDEYGDPIYETQKVWQVHFQLGPGANSISGTLHFRHGGIPDGTLYGKRSTFNRTNQVPGAGKFTFVLPGSGDPANTNFPTGNGFGRITIQPSGRFDLGGDLPDNSAIHESWLLCDDGTFPVYLSLYNGRGMIQGWMGLTNSPGADLTGDVVWVKPNLVGRFFFPAGFTNELEIVGSRYVRTTPALGWTNGLVIFRGGKLNTAFTNAILLNARGAVVNLSSNTLALKIQSNSGRFGGWAQNPFNGNLMPFQGVVLQNQNGGLGYFPDPPLSGEVLLAPAAP